jgi:hypothetical protein
MSRYAQHVFRFQHVMSLAFATEYCNFNVVQMSKFYMQLIALITFIIIVKLAGIPGVSRNDQWQNRIAILCIM